MQDFRKKRFPMSHVLVGVTSGYSRLEVHVVATGLGILNEVEVVGRQAKWLQDTISEL
jgi:ketopantoate reductase